jgi:hypothetical protein
MTASALASVSPCKADLSWRTHRSQHFQYSNSVGSTRARLWRRGAGVFDTAPERRRNRAVALVVLCNPRFYGGPHPALRKSRVMKKYLVIMLALSVPALAQTFSYSRSSFDEHAHCLQSGNAELTSCRLQIAIETRLLRQMEIEMQAKVEEAVAEEVALARITEE